MMRRPKPILALILALAVWIAMPAAPALAGCDKCTYGTDGTAYCTVDFCGVLAECQPIQRCDGKYCWWTCTGEFCYCT
jgi:hypothetical protein